MTYSLDLKEFKDKLEKIVIVYQDKIKNMGIDNITPELISDIKIHIGEGTPTLKGLGRIYPSGHRDLDIIVSDKKNIKTIKSHLIKLDFISEVIESGPEKLICRFPEKNQEERKKIVDLLSRYTEDTKQGVLKSTRQKELDKIKKEKLSRETEKEATKKIDEMFQKHLDIIKETLEKKKRTILQ